MFNDNNNNHLESSSFEAAAVEFSPSLGFPPSLLSLLSSSMSNPMAEEDVLQLFAQSEDVTSETTSSEENFGQSYEEKPEEKDEDLHPIACIRCRKMHKFCSRHKTGCERCKAKGIVCEFRESKRVRGSSDNLEDKKRKKPNSPSETESGQSDESELFVAPDASLTKSFPKHFSKPLAINCYYWMICDINVIVEKKEMEKYILHNFGTDTITKKEMEAFFYSAKALVEQFVGLCDIAEESAQKSKKKLALLIDQEPTHLIASTYYNLALYEIGTGRKISSYYLHCAKFRYMNKTALEVSNMNDCEIMLQRSIGFLEHLVIDEQDVTQMTKSFPALFQHASGQSLPDSIALSLQEEVTQENCFNFIKLGEEMAKLIITSTKNRACKQKTEKQMVTYDKALNFLQNIFCYGVRIGILVKARCNINMIEESSLKITYLTMNEFFGVASVFMIPFFALAARVHLQIVKSIEDGTRNNFEMGIGPDDKPVQIDYYDILAKDYRALNVLGRRFKRIQVCNQKLLSTIAEILNNRNKNDANVSNHLQEFLDSTVWK
ncbi:predicted protein [Naegleria gruberi]|uniref:Predicted protein n=1 Tax=Naegleria gruberi TaxID=5762 RepID=D2VYM0_NAEGR|nr:uncharacterized protein NAEGRDRAFT_59601 [Naegleria gruberi]EFC38080.1 predicted protein [Naegleria gruberi]|eukprot:XP_002670824.1 predicted protein [Naegleria gruberi strain NEG-M]